MYRSLVGQLGRTSPRRKVSRSTSRQSLRGRFELLEPRWVLSSPAPTTVGIGAPVLVAFNDPGAVAGTTFTAQSTNPALGATVLQTSEMLKMQVHTVNPDGSVGVSGEMDFLLLGQYAPNNIAHITSLVNAGFYNGLDFHRIIQDFMDQGGDPLGTGSGGSGFNGGKGQTLDDEFNVDLRFTSSGILAMANSGPDSNDCQFFITNAPYRSLDYGYTIIGKLVAGDAIRQAIAGVPVEANSSGEVSKPINPPIIDSVTIVPDVQYGLLMLKSGTGATAGQTSTVTVSASNGSSVTITASDGSSQASLGVTLATDTPSPNDRPAFITSIPDVYATMGQTTITFPVPVTEGDTGVALAYGALIVGNPSNLAINATGTGPSDGLVTITPTAGANVAGLYSVEVGVWNASSGGSNYDAQYAALYINPAAPATLSVTTSGVTAGGTTAINNGLTFQVTGVTSGLTVAIYADGGSTPIGTAVASSDTVDVTTTVPLADGSHTFTVEQFVSYSDTTVGNRTVPAGSLYSVASASTVSFTVDAPPTATANLSGVTNTGDGATFVVTYANAGDTIALSTIDDNNVLVTGPNSFSQLATLLSATPNADGSQVVATYRIDAPGGAWDSSNLGTYTATMQANQVSDSHGNFVAAGVLLNFNPSDLIAPSVTIDLAAGQAAATNVSPINFTVTFSEAVVDFAAGGVTIGGTATGTLVATVTPVGSDGTTYNVAVSGMTGDGTVTISLAAGAAHDAVGNPSLASTSTDNSVTYDTTAPTVTIDQAAPQKNPTNALEIKFAVVFSEAVTDFTGSDVTLGGTAGATTVVVSAWPGSSTEYTVTVSGMTGDGTVIASLLAGVAHDAAGNGNTASTSTGTDNSVTYEGTRPTVTIDRAATQTDPTSSSTIQFTVVFSESVSDFVTGDVTFGGTALGKLTATVTASGTGGTTYDVAVVGMTSSGTVTATVAAYEAHDAAGNGNIASTSTSNDNTVQFVLSQKPTFALTEPTSGTYNAGQSVGIAWKASNAIANTTISLCYDIGANLWNGSEKWIEIDQATAANGYGTYQWNTTGVAPGTYYIAGYLFSAGPIYSQLTQAITILGPVLPTFTFTMPAPGSYNAGQSVGIAWKAANVPTGATISLCYDTSSNIFNGNAKWIEIDQVTAAAGYGSYQWDTTGMKPGTYYIAGYLWTGSVPVYSELSQPITMLGPAQPTFTLTEPTSGSYNVGQNVGIAWKAGNVPAAATISLCYDTSSNIFDGNEKWIEIDQVSAANGYGSYQWNTAAVKPGTYYIAGYLWSGTAPTYSHLTQSITLAALLTLATPASAPEQPLPAADVLQSQSELTPIVNEAIQRWAAFAGSQVLAGVSVQIADLPGNLLGETIGKTILIDRNAAGYGWFIDPTPGNDSEFTPLGNGEMAALPQTAAAGHADLLTVVMHEMGHVLGYADDAGGDLMGGALPLGIRWDLAADQVFAKYSG